MGKQKVSLLLALVGVLAPALALQAQAPNALVGTWVLNVAKSKYSPGPAPQSNTIKVEASEGGLKVTTDGVNAQGQPTHTEYAVKFDGKEYPVTGSPDVDTYVAKRLGARSYQLVGKKGGKPTTTARIVISADGKTRTSTVTGKNAQGQVVKNTLVYNKQ